MMRHTLYIAFLVLISVLRVQSQNYVWAQRIGNTKSDKVVCVKSDAFGNVYISGYFSNTINIGTNNYVLNYVANATSKEAFVAKLDSNGVCLWAHAGGQYYDDRVLGMDVDSAGYCTITGTFWEGAGINWGSVQVTGSAYGCCDQCFIIRFDPLGNIVWGTFVCGDNTTPSGGNYKDDQGLDVAMDKYGNAYIVGFMTTVTLYCGGNTVTATNPNTTLHKHCYWLAKINSNGVFQWARTFGHLPWDGSYKYIERDIAVCVDESDGVYVTGGYDSIRHFGPQMLTPVGGYDIFVMKYDSLGNFKWVTGGGSDKDDWSNGICSDKNGHIYITGEHRDSLLVDTIIVKNYDKRDIFVIKMDASNGKPIWGKRAGSTLGSERGNDIWADANCNVYVAGDVNEGGKFGDNITAPSGKDLESFVAKISPDGKWRWLATGGSADSNDRGNAIAHGVGAQIYTSGYFRDNASYGSTSFASAGSSDGFFARLYDSTYGKGSGFDLHKPSDTVFCKEGSVTLAIDEHSFFDYNPKTGCTLNADESEMTFSPTTTTTYTLTGIGKDFCPDYDTVVFTIVIAPDPVASFTASPLFAEETQPNFTFTNTSTGAVSYQWLYNGSVFSTNQDETKTFNGIGKYCVTLVAISSEGCLDSTTECVEVIKTPLIMIPNAFSPNGDKVNDLFNPIFSNVDPSSIKNYSFMVVNRFGQTVFKSNHVGEGWDGGFQGRLCDVGSYYYFCKVELPHQGLKEYKGDVSLVH